jgi:hypothetical protein
MKNTSERPSLHVHEWLAVMAVIGLIGCLTAISWWNGHNPSTFEKGPPQFIAAQEIEINIQGAVVNPGRRLVKKGMTVREALAQAGLLAEADLQKVNLDAKVRRNQTIKVPKQATVTVYVEGAVLLPGPVVLPKGAKLQDLIDKLRFQDSADVEPLRKKRRLKEGETIVISTK